jgi:sulfite reductase alpha subunit-like flavoprotein
VQELLASLGDPLFDLLRRDPWIYVSGHRDMAADVRKLLVEARVSASLAVSTVAGERQIADAAVRMRYIESASG